jgi:hypothetical protein
MVLEIITVLHGLSFSYKWELLVSLITSWVNCALSVNKLQCCKWGVHQTSSRIPTAYPCSQVQDVEFAGNDVDTSP